MSEHTEQSGGNINRKKNNKRKGPFKTTHSKSNGPNTPNDKNTELNNIRKEERKIENITLLNFCITFRFFGNSTSVSTFSCIIH